MVCLNIRSSITFIRHSIFGTIDLKVQFLISGLDRGFQQTPIFHQWFIMRPCLNRGLNENLLNGYFHCGLCIENCMMQCCNVLVIYLGVDGHYGGPLYQACIIIIAWFDGLVTDEDPALYYSRGTIKRRWASNRRWVSNRFCTNDRLCICSSGFYSVSWIGRLCWHGPLLNLFDVLMRSFTSFWLSGALLKHRTHECLINVTLQFVIS